MNTILRVDSTYTTPDRKKTFFSEIFPTLLFYTRLFFIVLRASRKAKKGVYGGSDWADSSFEVLKRLEDAGLKIHISGIENIERQSESVVIIGNHMSMMETMVLPVIIQPLKDVTFVVKESLLSYPIFKHVIRSRNPVAVTRTNPRQDFKTVMTDGVAKLKNDVSIIVFPQTTRSETFDPGQMGSIGVKLAKKAGVPILPVALKTDAWQNGKKFKDFGKFDRTKNVYFAFGEPIVVEGKGGNEQTVVNEFIAAKLKEWTKGA